jgi:hypothetical protein
MSSCCRDILLIPEEKKTLGDCRKNQPFTRFSKIAPKSEMNFRTSFELARDKFLAARGPELVVRDFSSLPYKYLQQIGCFRKFRHDCDEKKFSKLRKSSYR